MPKPLRHLLRAAVLLCFAFATPVFAQSVTIEPEIAVHDQRIESGNIVKVQEVKAPADGFLVIHAGADETDAKPGTPIGYAIVNSGSNSNVSVKLEKDVTSGQKLVAVLHEDATQAGMFDADRDKPLAKSDGGVVMAAFVAR